MQCIVPQCPNKATQSHTCYYSGREAHFCDTCCNAVRYTPTATTTGPRFDKCAACHTPVFVSGPATVCLNCIKAVYEFLDVTLPTECPSFLDICARTTLDKIIERGTLLEAISIEVEFRGNCHQSVFAAMMTMLRCSPAAESRYKQCINDDIWPVRDFCDENAPDGFKLAKWMPLVVPQRYDVKQTPDPQSTLLVVEFPGGVTHLAERVIHHRDGCTTIEWPDSHVPQSYVVQA